MTKSACLDMEPSDWMDQPFISYAQNYEDVMLWRALRHIERGFYIDIGAWSPDLDSVTRAFSEREWRGINIEPNPYYFAQLTERRPNDINLRLAIGAHSGTTAMYFIPQSGLSTAAEKLVIDYRAKGWELREEVVELSTLAEVCSAYVASGLDIHFLKIDVEGLERDVLAGNDWSCGATDLRRMLIYCCRRSMSPRPIGCWIAESCMHTSSMI